MPLIEHKITINRSVSEIFRFVVDFGNTPKWQPPSVQLERAGKVKLGDMVVGKRRMMGRMVFVNADVVDVSPGQKLVYSGIMGGFPFRTTYLFNFTGSSGTQVTVTIDVRIPWFYFFMRPFVMSGLNGQTVTSLNNLKQYLDERRDLSS